ncbi:MAG: hypothetical protein ACTSXY_12365 [Promethearchaeota archaeon]
MLTRDWVIVLVLFGLISGVGYLIVEDIASSSRGYDVTNMTDANYQDRYDTLTESSSKIYLMQNATASKEGISVISTFTTMFSATFSIIGIIFGSLSMATTTLNNFGQDIGMSSTMANLVFGAISVIIISTIVFIIISSVSRGRL